MQIDMRVMELLASKICHDLVSPVSAINNGVELIEDIGGSVVDEAMKLIGDSATNASRRLRLFRMAYGRAGSEDNIAVKDVRHTAEQYLLGGKTLLHWGEGEPHLALTEHKGFLKTVLNIIILSEEVLAYGGVITLRSVAENPETACRFEIVGRNAQLNDSFNAALYGTVAIEDLTPRTIQAYVVGRMMEQFGLSISHDNTLADRLDLTLMVKSMPLPA
jgi:histidine phosphotransferase ChpT